MDTLSEVAFSVDMVEPPNLYAGSQRQLCQVS